MKIQFELNALKRLQNNALCDFVADLNGLQIALVKIQHLRQIEVITVQKIVLTLVQVERVEPLLYACELRKIGTIRVNEGNMPIKNNKRIN